MSVVPLHLLDLRLTSRRVLGPVLFHAFDEVLHLLVRELFRHLLTFGVGDLLLDLILADLILSSGVFDRALHVVSPFTLLRAAMILSPGTSPFESVSSRMFAHRFE